MVSSGGIDNGRPVLFSSLRFNCLAKNLTFVNMNLKSGMMVFIQTAPCGAVCILYEKGSFVIQSNKMKKILYIVIAVAVLVGVLFLFKGDEEKRDVLGAQSHKEAEYLISGSKVKLENGIAESEAAPGSASKIITRYFGNDVVKDLNGDG